MRKTRLTVAISFIICILLGSDSKAQSLKNTIEQVKNLNNISLTEVVRFKFSFQDDFSIDTLNSQIVIINSEPQIGGYYQIKGENSTYLFDGNKAVSLNLSDSTYSIQKDPQINQFTRSLLYWKKQIEIYLKSPSKIKQLKDTLIDKKNYNHFLITLKDSIEKGIRIYSFTNIVTDKKSNLPFIIRSDFKGFGNDGAIIGVVEYHIFENYRKNDKNFMDLSIAQVPNGFRLPVKEIAPTPLAIGSIAPQIKLTDSGGNSFDVKKLKGKIILINFALLGCPHSANSAQMLNRLKEMFKETDFEIISVYELRNDTQSAISKYDSKSNIKYPSYTTNDPVKSTYSFQGFPSFYLIDKQGNIANYYEGFYLDLEKELIAKIINSK